jgi:catechol 2,3-dioxygenase-like lactoylglutathione lyase family enzyme
MDGPPTLSHVRLLVEAYERCFRFYAEELGFEPTFGDATSGYADFDTGSVSLALYDAGEMADALGETPGGERGRDGAALVLRVGDVDAAYSDLADADCERVAPPRDRPDWGIRVAHVRDPDGSLLEVNEPLEG